MVPRLKTQTSGDDSQSRSRTTMNARLKERKHQRKMTNGDGNHILSKFGYSPQRKNSDSLMTIRKSPSRPQPFLHDSSLSMQQQQYEDGESGVVNPYRMLQIRRDANKSEIKQAYRRLALWHHPNRNQSTLSNAERERRLRIFVVLAACCETLLERDSRSRLDSLLKGRARALPSHGSTMTQQRQSNWIDDKPQQKQQRRTEFRSDLPMLYLSNSASFSDSSTDETPSRPQQGGGQSGWFDWAHQCGGGDATPKPSCARNTSDATPLANNNRRRRRLGQTESCSTDEDDRIHYTQKETNKLFGGPLSIMYRARAFRAFSDPYTIFDRVFGSRAFPDGYHHSNQQNEPSTPPKASALAMTKASTTPPHPHTALVSSGGPPLRSSAWSGLIETLKDGTTVYTTVRILNDRKLIKREVISMDPVTKQQRSIVTVTAEDLCNSNPHNKDYSDDQSQSTHPHNEDAAVEYDYWACCKPTLFFTSHSKRRQQQGSVDEGEDYRLDGINLPLANFYRMNCVVW